MNNRRQFLKISAMGAAFFSYLRGNGTSVDQHTNPGKAPAGGPIVLSTWDHGIPANQAAWDILSKGGRALDAVEKGVMVPEADPKVNTVGYGGLPDRDGKVTLDACIMDEYDNCGSVAFLQNIMHPISPTSIT